MTVGPYGFNSVLFLGIFAIYSWRIKKGKFDLPTIAEGSPNLNLDVSRQPSSS